jgi:hypothetical protein
MILPDISFFPSRKAQQNRVRWGYTAQYACFVDLIILLQKESCVLLRKFQQNCLPVHGW